MLPKKQKLTKKDFRSLKSGGRSFHSPHLTLRVYKSPNGKQSRFSFVVSKKVSKKSVGRNRLKRIGYQTVKSIYSNIKSGASCVFFVKNGSENLPQSQLSKEIAGLFETAGLLL